jgi:hypothetical protein
MQITVFKELLETKVPYHRSVDWAIERIRNGKNKDKIQQIRSEKDDSIRNELKAKLPSYIFSGVFNHRSKQGIEQFNGLIGLDFDKFESESDLLDFKEMVKQIPYTFLCFISPSGNGLKVFFRIPTDELEFYSKYFDAIEKFFSHPNWDKSVKDFSRVCYESYDPELYHNPNATTWTIKEMEEPEDLGTISPSIAIKSENRIITNLLTWFNSKYSMNSGERNTNLFKLAASLNDFGIDKNEAINVCLQFETEDFNRSEIDTIVKSAYRHTHKFGTKFFEDRETKEIIEKSIREGKDDKEIYDDFQSFDRAEIKKVVSSIRKEITVDDFWDYNKKGAVVVSPHKYKYWLESRGFYKYYPEATSGFTFVHKDQNLLTITDEDKIKDYVLDYLISRDDIGFKPYDFMANSTKYFAREFLKLLDTIDLEIKKDTKDECFLYYQNGVVAIAKDSVELIDYVDVNGFVWKDQIINRDYKKVDSEGDFKQFVNLIANKDQKRFNSLKSVIGYLCHNYKTPAYNRAIVINDETISENPNGRSGKGLLTQAVGKVRNIAAIDGKTFSFDKAFPYQTVKVDTQVMIFDDVRKNFKFENLFSLITEGITLEYKGKDAIKLPVSKSPKVVITTNYTIGGVGGSFEGRKFEIELSDYFSFNHTPFDEFGRMMFDDWNPSDWNAFDQFIVECIQVYLEHGLIKHDFNNLEVRKFIKETSYEFYEWTLEGNLPVNVRMKRAEYHEQIIEDYPDLKKWLSQRMFYSWFEIYARFKGYKYTSGKTNGSRWICLETEDGQVQEDEFEAISEAPF